MKTNEFNLMKLSPGAERLLLTLKYYAGSKGVCFPSQDTLMKALGITRKPALKKYVNELVTHDLVSYNLSLSNKKLASGKIIPERHIKYFVVSDNLYLSVGGSQNALYLNISSQNDSRKEHPATVVNVPVTIPVSISSLQEKEKAWNTHSSKVLRSLQITDPDFIEQARQAYLDNGKSVSASAVRSFITKQKEWHPPGKKNWREMEYTI